MTTATINFVNLNKRCEGWFMGINAAAPLCHGTPEVVGAAIAGIGADEIRVEARTSSDPKEVARDLRTYTKRLHRIALVCGYKVNDFVPFGSLLKASLVR